MKILLADDDVDMLDVTAFALRREGFTVSAVTDGVEALRRWRTDDPDLLLLDVGMPRLNGFEVCRRIRQDSRVPVIMLTAAGDEDHIVQGYQLGADDYVTKPFSPKQLALRIRAVLRRSSSVTALQPVGEVRIGDMTLDLEGHQIQKGDVRIQLTPLEFRIVQMLTANVGRVVGFERLVEFTWGYDSGDATVLKTHICHIRKKLGLKKGQPGDIVVVHGVGYCLTRRHQEAEQPID